jgi:ATP-dependent DNA ligase
MTRDARREWRPLKPRATRRPPVIADPVLEPLWSGTRVLAHFVVQPEGDGPPELQLIDEKGADVTAAAPAAAASLRESVMALEAVIDGVLTTQPSLGGSGTALIPRVQAPRLAMFVPRPADLVYERPPQPGDETAEVCFVAVDLLSVDDLPLVDLPLLERRRQLESLFVQDELIRISPMVRPPIGPWLNSWQAAGFAGMVMKAANSRYRPGDFTVEWTIIRQAPARP